MQNSRGLIDVVANVFELRGTAQYQEGMHSRLNRAADVGFHCVPNHHRQLRLTQRQFSQLAMGAVEHVTVRLAEVVRAPTGARFQKGRRGAGAGTGFFA